MKNKTKKSLGVAKQVKNFHPGMMGDGTEEQNLNQRGNPAARIRENEVDAAFRKRPTQGRAKNHDSIFLGPFGTTKH
jgi:hypothetical protein